MYRKINIAIDGPAASGKSAAALLLAKKINYDVIDTGIMYRSFTNYCLKNQIPFDNEQLLVASLENFEIKWEKGQFLFNDLVVDEAIYSAKVTSKVPLVAAVAGVRKIMVTKIQTIVKNQGFIVVGRDIASIVLPQAQLKIFLTSSLEVRSQRRYNQYLAEGIKIKQLQIYQDLVIRDHVDKTRSTGKLIITKDAIVLDNSNYDLQTTVEKLSVLYHNYFNHKNNK